MSSAGYQGLIYRSGTSTAMVAEACSNVSGKTYRVTDSAKRMLDPSVAVVVDDNGSPVSASDIESIDYLHGIVTFDSSYTVTGPVTIDSNYLPRTFIGSVHEMSASMAREELDNTAFAESHDGAKTHQLGLRSISGSFSAYDATATALSALMESGTVLYLTLAPAGSLSARHLRARVLLTGIDGSTSVDGLNSTTYNFAGASLKSVEGRDVSHSLNY